MEDLLYYAREVVNETLGAAYLLWPSLSLSCFIKIEFGLRGSCAGFAYYGQNKIKLNEQLFRENQDGFIQRTIPHEVAHLISFALYGREGIGHGERWQSVMRALGVNESRCHCYKVTPARKVRFYPVACACRTHRISSIKLNRIKRNPHRYICKRCKSILTLGKF